MSLSYRWGNTRNSYALTQETFGEMITGLPTAVLPRTIGDACYTASRLGVPYLWVDRLCIFQDSRRDWHREAAKMAMVYRNSFCTISASGACNEDEGYFFSRNKLGIRPMFLTASPLLRGNTCFYSTPPEDDTAEGKLGHLSKRGWVFQERNISTRVVHFGRQQVYWECAELEVNEIWPVEISLFHRTSGYHRGRPHLNSYKPTLNDSWMWIVREYSKTELTYHSDKLPALAGMANEMGRTRKDEYLAGLWRGSLIEELCWNCVGRVQKPQVYRAPSWSWASVDAQVSLMSGSTRFARVEDARTDQTGTGMFGEVCDGWLLLYGHLLSAVINHKLKVTLHSIPCNKAQAYETFAPWIEWDHQSHIFFDIEPSSLEKGGVPTYCVPVMGFGNMAGIYCLLVVPKGTFPSITMGTTLASPESSNKEEYQRIGLVSLSGVSCKRFKTWLSKEAPLRDIIIR